MDVIGLLKLPARTGANLSRINTSFHLFKVDKWRRGALTELVVNGKRKRNEWGTFREAFKSQTLSLPEHVMLL